MWVTSLVILLESNLLLNLYKVRYCIEQNLRISIICGWTSFSTIFTEGLVCLKYDCRWELFTGRSLDLGNIKSDRDIKRNMNGNTHLKSDDIYIRFNNLHLYGTLLFWKSFFVSLVLKTPCWSRCGKLTLILQMIKCWQKKLSALFKVTYVAA